MRARVGVGGEWSLSRQRKCSRAARRTRLACGCATAHCSLASSYPRQTQLADIRSEHMASSNEIPNLRTLLGQGRGGATRGKSRGRGGTGGSNTDNDQAKDNAVKGTDQDAAGSRVSCVELGYLCDPYAKLFATQQTVRRLPLLNRGIFKRYLLAFSSAADQCRILYSHFCN